MDTSFEKKYYELEEGQWWCLTRRELLVSLVENIPRQSKVLEIGCSAGFLLKSLKEKGFSSLIGIDVSAQAVALSQEKGLEAYVQDGARPEFPPATFDLILASDVLEHIEDDASALHSWFKLLRSGGKLICFVPAFGFLWSEHDAVNQHKRRYSLSGLSAVVRKAGFVIEQKSYWDFFLFPAVAVVRGIQRVLLLLRSRSSQPKDQFYAFGGGLINSSLIALLRFENALLLKGVDFFCGVSCFVVARKP